MNGSGQLGQLASELGEGAGRGGVGLHGFGAGGNSHAYARARLVASCRGGTAALVSEMLWRDVREISFAKVVY